MIQFSRHDVCVVLHLGVDGSKEARRNSCVGDEIVFQVHLWTVGTCMQR